MSDEKRLSTTQLAKLRGVSQEQMFGQLTALGLIEKQEDKWQLTGAGTAAGGVYLTGKYGQYVAWPEDFQLPTAAAKAEAAKLLTATELGQHFELSANKMNYILSELGWIKKGLKGWLVTEQGLAMGAEQGEDSRSGIPYVRWPEKIARNRALKDNVDNIKGVDKPKTDADKMDSFRHKFEATHRTTDGHFVRSKAEMLIDNWLYMAEIVHAYERKLPIEEEMYCDFYIPTGKVYIEFWGYENDAKYQARKQEKLAIYRKYNFNLIELTDKDVLNLDDILPRLLLRFGVQAY
ncbi:glycerol kinase [Methylomonas rivi]|uniref:Glycerol kinase n=1 Tax=Methylomonas rivi TaxID=2952226 RepID=A0ABT1U583_9GAMM|nr:glycerol kinase [Methylomonas sp. WSC-6]MCQ8129016.1 glycerol kinase [Methylomonas sp. WSC-6]